MSDINYLFPEWMSKTMEEEDGDGIVDGNSSIGIRIGCRLRIEEFTATNDVDMLEQSVLNAGYRQPDAEEQKLPDDVSADGAHQQEQPQQQEQVQEIVVSKIVALFGDVYATNNPHAMKIGAAGFLQLIVNFFFRNLQIKWLLAVDVVTLVFVAILFLLLDLLRLSVASAKKPPAERTRVNLLKVTVHDFLVSAAGMLVGFCAVSCYNHIVQADEAGDTFGVGRQRQSTIDSRGIHKGDHDGGNDACLAYTKTSMHSSFWSAQILDRLDPRTYTPLLEVIAFIIFILFFAFRGDLAIQSIRFLLGLIMTIIGNTIGAFIFWPCGHCGKLSTIASYGGNLAQGNVECYCCRLYLFGQKNKGETRPVECHKCLHAFVLASYKRKVVRRWMRNTVDVYCPECNELQD